MIKIVEVHETDFEMPNSCYNCPAFKTTQDSNYHVDTCKLKKDSDWVNETVSASCDKRDPNCPLDDGKSYKIYTYGRNEKQISVT